MLLKKQAPNILQLGIHLQNEQWQILWFDAQNKPHFITLKNKEKLSQILLQQPWGNKDITKWICSLPIQHVWVKTLTFTQKLTKQECEQQCDFILENEFPSEFDQIWYDYQYTEFSQGVKLTIYAVKQDIAKDYVANFYPLKITVLDYLTNSLIRAFQYFQEQTENTDFLYLYQYSQGCIAVGNGQQKNKVLQQTDKNITALYHSFCKRFDFTPKQVWCYLESGKEIDSSVLNIPKDWIKIDTELPFIALGNALWGKNNNQSEIQDN